MRTLNITVLIFINTKLVSKLFPTLHGSPLITVISVLVMAATIMATGELCSKQNLMRPVVTVVKCSSLDSLMLNPQEVQKGTGEISPGYGHKLSIFGIYTTSGVGSIWLLAIVQNQSDFRRLVNSLFYILFNFLKYLFIFI